MVTASRPGGDAGQHSTRKQAPDHPMQGNDTNPSRWDSQRWVQLFACSVCALHVGWELP